MLGSLGLQDKRKTNAFVLVAIMSTSSTAFAGCCAATSAQLSILAGSAVVRMPLVTARVRGMCHVPLLALAIKCHFLPWVSSAVSALSCPYLLCHGRAITELDVPERCSLCAAGCRLPPRAHFATVGMAVGCGFVPCFNARVTV